VAARRSVICKGCWQQLRLPILLRGPASAPFRVVGIRPSRMNPNTCTVCELMFTRVMRARKIAVDVTVLFADLRGYTALSEKLSPEDVSELLDAFYDECAEAIWSHDGLLNKTIGDAVMAVFNFPIRRDGHATNAVLAARRIQQQFPLRAGALAGSQGNVGVGIGIDSGEVSFGEFGRAHRDLTAIGTVVNLAARAQSEAAAGQILITRSVHDRALADVGAATASDHVLKGFEHPVPLYAA
jgi:class 3 adenylate cyclase